jgi:hypothetical protein
MQQISTPELLVKHLYNETNKSEADALQQELNSNPETAQLYTKLQDAKNALEENDGEMPSVNVVEKILAYSNANTLEEIH